MTSFASGPENTPPKKQQESRQLTSRVDGTGGGQLSLPKTGYGPLMQRLAQGAALQSPLLQLLQDTPFIRGLSCTDVYGGVDTSVQSGVPGALPSITDAINAVRADVQMLVRQPHQEGVTSAARALISGILSLYTAQHLYIDAEGSHHEEFARKAETAHEAGIEGGELTPEIEMRLETLGSYLSIILESVEKSAASFKSPELWGIIDTYLIKPINEQLKTDLERLNHPQTLSQPNILTAVAHLETISSELSRYEAEGNKVTLGYLTALSSAVLRRLDYAVDQLELRQVRSTRERRIHDVLAERLAIAFGKEINALVSGVGHAPMIRLFKSAQGSGYSFVSKVFEGFYGLHSDFFQFTRFDGVTEATGKSRTVSAYSTLGQAAGTLWPGAFAKTISERLDSLEDPKQLLVALNVLKFGIGNDHRLHEKLFFHLTRLLGHGSLEVRTGVRSALQEMHEPYLDFVTQDHDRNSPYVQYRREILRDVYLPLLHRARLTSESLEQLGPMIGDIITTYGGIRDALRVLPELGAFVTSGTFQNLHGTFQHDVVLTLLEKLFETSNQQIDEALKDSVDRGIDNAARSLAASGEDGIIFALDHARQLMDMRRELHALKIIRASAKALALTKDTPHWKDESQQKVETFFTEFALHNLLKCVHLLHDDGEGAGASMGSGRDMFGLDSSDPLSAALAATIQGTSQESDEYRDLILSPYAGREILELWGEINRAIVRSKLISPQALTSTLTRLSAQNCQLILLEHTIAHALPESETKLKARAEHRLLDFLDKSTRNVRVSSTNTGDLATIRNYLLESPPITEWPPLPLRSLLGKVDTYAKQSKSLVYVESGTERLTHEQSLTRFLLQVFGDELSRRSNTPLKTWCPEPVLKTIQRLLFADLSDRVARLSKLGVHAADSAAYLMDATCYEEIFTSIFSEFSSPKDRAPIGWLTAFMVERNYSIFKNDRDTLDTQVKRWVPLAEVCLAHLEQNATVRVPSGTGHREENVYSRLNAVLSMLPAKQNFTSSFNETRSSVESIPRLSFNYSPGQQVHLLHVQKAQLLLDEKPER